MTTEQTNANEAARHDGSRTSSEGLGPLPEPADEWTKAVWESWCDMPREGQTLKWRDVLLYGEACYAKAVAAERERCALFLDQMANDYREIGDDEAASVAAFLAAGVMA